jgi:hypothetical protein
MGAAAAKPGETENEPTKLYRVLSAPLLVTLVGAVVAGLLIPRVASRVEDHRKAREIQTSLVRDMSQAVARVTLTGQLLAIKSIQKENANGTAVFDTALLAWEVDKATIEAQLRAYFSGAKLGGEGLPDAWANYGAAVDNLYYLSTSELRDRCTRTKALMTYLDVSVAGLRCPNRAWTGPEWGAACKASTSWNALAICDEDSLKPSGEGYVRGVGYFAAYRSASSELLAAEEVLLDAVRGATPSGFRT